MVYLRIFSITLCNNLKWHKNKNTHKNKKYIPKTHAIQASTTVGCEFQNLQIDLFMKANASVGIEMHQGLVEFEVLHNQQF